MTALIDRIGAEVDAIDVFCGYGGSSQGIHAAGATVRAAANHSALAIECHAANFPDVEHWQCDMVDANDPQVINRAGKKVPTTYLRVGELLYQIAGKYHSAPGTIHPWSLRLELVDLCAPVEELAEEADEQWAYRGVEGPWRGSIDETGERIE